MAHRKNQTHSVNEDYSNKKKLSSLLDLSELREQLIDQIKPNSQEYKSDNALSNQIRDLVQSFIKMKTYDENNSSPSKHLYECHNCERIIYLKEKIKQLKQQVMSTKIFLSMVIHEMRNPALSIKLALIEVLKYLQMDEQMKNQEFAPNNDILYSDLGQRKFMDHSHKVKIIQPSNLEQAEIQYRVGDKPQMSESNEESKGNQESSIKNNEMSQHKSFHSPYFRHGDTQFFETFDLLEVDDEKQENIMPHSKDYHSNTLVFQNESRSQSQNQNSLIKLVNNFQQDIYIMSDKYTNSLLNNKIQQLKDEEKRLQQPPSPNFQTPLFRRDKSKSKYSFNKVLTLQHMNQSSEEDQPSNQFMRHNSNNHVLDICGEYFQKGIVLKKEIRIEIERLLKNSLFSSQMIHNLVDDLLDLAKMENQSFNLNSSYFNLFEIINNSLENVEFQAKQKQIELMHETNQEHIGYFLQIYGDQNRYLQILLNFLSNAIKFTPKSGKIIVETIVNQVQPCTVQRGEANNNDNNNNIQNKFGSDEKLLIKKMGRSQSVHCRRNDNKQDEEQAIEYYFIDFEIRIKDSGYGISEQNIKKLFVNFRKLEEHAKMNEKGTGLGLSICKSLIEMMGGSVRVESQVGEGTSFIVQLKTKCKYISQASKSKSILKNLDKKYLKAHPQQNNQTYTIQAHLLNELENDSSYEEEKLPIQQSSLSSMGEPLNNKRLQALDKKGNQTNKLQSNYQSQMIKISQQLNINDVVAPPIKILVANDCTFTLSIIGMLFKKFGITIDEAENGLVALNMSRLNKYDIIILDLNMPIMDGFEACKRIKKSYDDELKLLLQLKDNGTQSNRSKFCCEDEQNGQKTPIIIALSGYVTDQDRVIGKDAGFDEFFESPLTKQIIQEKIINRFQFNNLNNQQEISVSDNPGFSNYHYQYSHQNQRAQPQNSYQV